jgi:carboxypeptidase C (cathepsin A)
MSEEAVKTPATEGAKSDPAVEPPPHHREHVVHTDHEMKIGRRTVPYRATAGRILLKDEDGKKLASLFYTSYHRTDVEDTASRPIVFAFNGGPGSSSVWLHLGLFGPKRVELDDEGRPISLPGRLVENEHSILDVADLVFIDPIGTGYSRGIPAEDTKKYAHFKKDIESVSEFIRLYLTRNGRWDSPKYLAGESYGTTRAGGIAAHMLDHSGVSFNGLILISAILHFGTAPFDPATWTFQPGTDIPYVTFLPTYAASAWYHGKLERKHQRKKLRTFLDEVEAFAIGEYASALILGDSLPEDRFDKVAAKVADYTGLPVDYVKRYRLRIEILRFCKALRRDEGLTIGRLDSRYTGHGRFDEGDTMESDPSGDAISGQYSALLNAYLRSDLGYETDLPYEVLSYKVFEAWDYEDFKAAHVDVSERLRSTLVRNTHMRVFVANGYYDLATPHFATEYTVNHMGLKPETRQRIDMAYYEAGHMMYAHLPSLAKLAGDLRGFLS